MRKLPVFFLIDLSESMVGEPLDLVKKGMEHLIRGLKKNPFALETVWIEIIGFAGKAKILEPFEELPLFYPPDFFIGGGTAIGNGVEFLMKEIDSNVSSSTPSKKGDWKPLVFIFTDGQPTDNYSHVLNKWENDYKSKCQTIVATLGDIGSSEFISRIADEAIQLQDSSDESFDSYFKWMTDSIVSSSIQVSEGIDPTHYDKELNDGLSKIDLSKNNYSNSKLDDNFTVLLGSCQQNNEQYLIKYQKGIESTGEDIDDFDKVFRAVGAYKIDYDVYKELSGEVVINHIDTNLLRGVPSCPYCGSKHSLVVCECGGIFCYDETKQEQTCSWCGKTDYYGAAEGNFDIERRQG